MPESRICSVESCGKELLARGFCRAHYARFRKYGNPLAGSASPGEALKFFENVVLPCQHDDCLIWPYTRLSNGYARLWYDGRRQRVSRLVCELVHGTPPTDTHEAAHSCGRRDCVNPRHLRWATPKENCADKIIHGTHSRGFKLTEVDVRAIRQAPGTLREISAMFSVDESTVSLIKRRKRWKHV